MSDVLIKVKDYDNLLKDKNSGVVYIKKTSEERKRLESLNKNNERLNKLENKIDSLESKLDKLIEALSK